MKLAAMFLALASAAHAAVLSGVVLDFESGRPLARTGVTLTALQSATGAQSLSTRTESNGTFFFNTGPGVYLLTASRQGFSRFHYGANCWNCEPAPIYLQADDKTPVDIRMHRLGAITGAVQDENLIGIPGIEVVAYSATRPLHEAGRARTDDRGFFRVGELEPGIYVIRTVPTVVTDGTSYLASFYPNGTELRDARQISVELDHTWPNVDFPAIPGRFYRVQGRVTPPNAATTVELITESGRQSAPIDGAGNYSFDRVAPGAYELFAESKSTGTHIAAWLPVAVEHDTDANLQLSRCGANLRVETGQHQTPTQDQVAIRVRRHDLDKNGPEQIVKPTRVLDLAPGNWDFAADSLSMFPARVLYNAIQRSKSSADGWTTVPVRGPDTPILIYLSTHPSTLSGRVMDSVNVPAAFAPVFLESIGLEPPDPPIIRIVRAGSDGSYKFFGLPPGRYRIISSFDLEPTDRMAMEYARPAEISVSENAQLALELSLYHKQ